MNGPPYPLRCTVQTAATATCQDCPWYDPIAASLAYTHAATTGHTVIKVVTQVITAAPGEPSSRQRPRSEPSHPETP